MTRLLTQVTGSGPIRRLEIKISIGANILSVWNALTDSQRVKYWWTTGVIEAKEGGRFILDEGEEVNGTVKVCHAPYMFEFSWNDSPKNAGHPDLIDHLTKSTVRFDLVELGADQTGLNFVQFLPPGQIVGAAAGWHEIVGERLKSYLETGKAFDNPSRFSELKKLYEEAGVQ